VGHPLHERRTADSELQHAPARSSGSHGSRFDLRAGSTARNAPHVHKFARRLFISNRQQLRGVSQRRQGGQIRSCRAGARRRGGGRGQAGFARLAAAILEKENAVEEFRKLIGATNPAQADEGTIRKLFATSIGENAVHGSDSDENAKIEGDFFFSKLEQF